MVTAATKLKRCLLLGRKVMTNLDSILKSRHYFANKGPSSQGYGFSSSHVWMWELDYKESWALKNWCFWSMVLEKTLESPLDCKEIQPAHPKGDQSWVFIGRTDVEAETPILWPPDVKSWLIWKDPDAGKDWGRRGRQRMRWLVGITDSMDMGSGELWELVNERGLECCSSWGHKESDTAEQLNWIESFTEKVHQFLIQKTAKQKQQKVRQKAKERTAWRLRHVEYTSESSHV